MGPRLAPILNFHARRLFLSANSMCRAVRSNARFLIQRMNIVNFWKVWFPLRRGAGLTSVASTGRKMQIAQRHGQRNENSRLKRRVITCSTNLLRFHFGPIRNEPLTNHSQNIARPKRKDKLLKCFKGPPSSLSSLRGSCIGPLF